jgi:hypothetical protein
MGSAKANGREPKSWLAREFNFKLDSFTVAKDVHGTHARTCLKLPMLVHDEKVCYLTIGIGMG